MKKVFGSILKILGVVFLAIIAFNVISVINLDSSASSGTSDKFLFPAKDVKMVKETKNAWGVVGMIKNYPNEAVKGGVKIKFLNSNGDVVYSSKAFVNSGDELRPGQSANFEYYTDPSKFNGVTDFDVEFFRR
jgi:hypothetical protein